MPALFVGHGNPMNAIDESRYSRGMAEVAATLPRPRAILCISAHWQTDGISVTAMEKPRTIHDFRGFPKALFEVQYPAPGSPALAELVCGLLSDEEVHLDEEWGLDHGCWAVLRRMYPEADIPVVQLSLDLNRSPEQHYALGRQLAGLRHRGVLVIGSGNIVHNLSAIIWDEEARLDWAEAFDAKVSEHILAGDDKALIHWEKLGPEAKMAVPTDEHFLPLLYILGMREAGETVHLFNEGVSMGSLSMASLLLSGA